MRLRIQTERKNAADCFEMYVEILHVMKDTDPALFGSAIDIVKKRFKDVKLTPVGPLTKKFPDLVPDMFSRLW